MRKYLILALVAGFAAQGVKVAAAETAGSGQQAFFQHICADANADARHAKYVDWLKARLSLNEAQKASFQAFQDARAKSLADSKAKLCAKQPDLSTFEARLVFDQAFVEARLEALKSENPKLIAFYNSLDEKQKTSFDEVRRQTHP